MLLRDEFHIIARSAMSTEDEAPYIIAPEQVILLVQHGYGRVRVKKESELSTPNKDDNFEDGYLLKSGNKRATVNVVEKETEALKMNKKSSVKMRQTLAEGGLSDTKHSSKENSTIVELGSDGMSEVVNLRKDPDDGIYRWMDEFEVPVPCTREFRARQLVYYDLWSRGYYLTSGEQFGTTWLVYEGTTALCQSGVLPNCVKNTFFGLPNEVHASFLVDFIFDDQMMIPTNFVALIRVAVQVKKNLVLAVVSPDSTQPHYVIMDWLRPQGVDE